MTNFDMVKSVEFPFVVRSEWSAWEFWGRLSGEEYPENPSERYGARLDSTSRCTECGGPFKGGESILLKCAPNMAGTAKHRECP